MTSPRAITTFHWSTVPPERLAPEVLDTLGPLHTTRTEPIGIQRMSDLLERFIKGAALTDIRTGSIADIHGNVEGLRRELTFCKANGVTDLVCTGDFIDRDPHSIQVINELRAAQIVFKLVPLIGNHDLFFLRAMLGSKRDLMTWLGNGGMTVLCEPEVGLEHWGRYVAREAEMCGISPQQWVRNILPRQPEMIDKILRDIQSNECLNVVADWMQKNLHLSHLSEQGLLYVHAGIPTNPDGTHALFYRSGKETYQGLWALAKAEEDLFGALEAKLPAHPVYDFLEGRNSPVWIRDWEHGPTMDLTKCNRLLDSLGVSGIVVGHTVQDRIEGVHEGRIILGDRGLAVAYQNQPAVVLAARSEGIRCVTTTARSLSMSDSYESRIARARRYAKHVVESRSGGGYDDTPTMRLDGGK